MEAYESASRIRTFGAHNCVAIPRCGKANSALHVKTHTLVETYSALFEAGFFNCIAQADSCVGIGLCFLFTKLAVPRDKAGAERRFSRGPQRLGR